MSNVTLFSEGITSGVCSVFSESKFYCILVSPMIICRFEGSINNFILMDANRYFSMKKLNVFNIMQIRRIVILVV